MSTSDIPASDLPTIWRVPDALWDKLAPLLRNDKFRKKSGRPRRDDRQIFDALIYLARTGCQWCALPPCFPPKSTVHERFSEWIERGCLNEAWMRLLDEYDEVLEIDWQWQAADGCIVKAPLGKKGPPLRKRRQAATPPTGAKPDVSVTF